MTLPGVTIDAGSTGSGAAEVDPASPSGAGGTVRGHPPAEAGFSHLGPAISAALYGEESGSMGTSATELPGAACDAAAGMGDAAVALRARPSTRRDTSVFSAGKAWSGTGPCAATHGDGASLGVNGVPEDLESAACDAGGAIGTVATYSTPGRAGIVHGDGGTAFHDSTLGGGESAVGDGGTATQDAVRRGCRDAVHDGGTAAHGSARVGGSDCIDSDGTVAHQSMVEGASDGAGSGGVAHTSTLSGGGSGCGRWQP